MKYLLIILCCLQLCAGHAQTKQSIWFLKNDGREVRQEDADFYRVIQRDPGSENFLVFEYYPDKTRKFIGKVSTYQPWLEYEGPANWYDKSGAKVKSVTFEKGTAKGLASFYYPNGNLSKIVEYRTDSGMICFERGKPVKMRVKQYFDSAGLEIPMDGMHIITEDTENSYFKETGAYLDGLKTGLWTGHISALDSRYRESYLKGELISGEITFSNGDKKVYSKVEELPEFPGGSTAWTRYIQKHFIWPRDAVEMNLAGKEVIAFYINADGSLSDIRVAESILNSVDKAATQMLVNSPQWKPGSRHGSPARFALTLPLNMGVQKERATH